MENRTTPAARAEMLIRKPVAEVFEAFIDPDLTSKFWFSRGSARLEPGRDLTWHWDMYGVSMPVQVRAVEPHQRIAIDWPGEGGDTQVEWRFTQRPDGTTFVSIVNTGFRGDDDSILRQVVDSTEGFALVLSGLKAWCEHGLRLNLVADRFPDGLKGEG